MAFGFIFSRGERNSREGSLRAAVDALNALDYDRVAAKLHPSVIALHPRGFVTKGRQEFVRFDRTFRQALMRPRIVVTDIIHHNREVLVTGRLETDDPDIGGPTMWRVEFLGDLISRVETTRAQDNGMALREVRAMAV